MSYIGTVLNPTEGGTGVANTSTITVGGNTSLIGAHTFAGTLTGNTAITFPTSGTLATTASIPSFPLSPANGGTGVSNTGTITLGGNLATSGSFASTFTMTGATNVTFPTSGTLATTAGLPSFPLSGDNGGTGIANTGLTITLGGNLATSGAFGTTFTVTGITNVTLPTSGTLVNTSVTTLSSLTSIGTIGTGVWQGTIINPTYGGTGVNNGSKTITLGGNLTTSGAFNSAFTMTNTTAVTFPTTGTLATTSQLPTPAALTSGNDTNVTLTLGGTPSTALLQAASITAGWSGTLALARGGLAANLTASNGGIFYSTASAGAILAGTATASQLLLSGASTTPSWSTSTYPSTNAINTILYASSANVMAALATANNGVLITSAGGVPSISSTLPTAVQQNITTVGQTSTTTTLAGGQVMTRTATAASTYSAGANDYIIGCTGTATTAITVTLPATTVAGQVYIIKDEAGGANTNNITVSAGGTTKIDGGTTVILNQAFAALSVYANVASGQYYIT